MTDETVSDRARLVGLVVAHGLQSLARTVRRPVRSLSVRRNRVPRRLLIAPQDIRTADPTVAADIYSGYFVFEGKGVNTRGSSPFDVPPPSEAWAEALAGFGWLRHLRAADTALARVNARALVSDWFTVAKRAVGRPGRRPAVVARRVLSWLSQSPLILAGADGPFYRRFMRSLVRHVDALEAEMDGLDGRERLTAAVALVEVALCADGMATLLRQSTPRLAEELGRQILADGGHVSRDPGALVDILADLLPLRQVYAARGVAPPQLLLNAIDRMVPMIKTFRHADGSLGLFNGMGVTRPDMLATVLAYDDTRGSPLGNAPYSGYQRLEAGSSLLLVDAGAPPSPPFAKRAHAGTLAFEFSVGTQRVVVNCGAASINKPDAYTASRATAAHSTLVLADRSSSRFARKGPLRGVLYGGPRVVSVARSQASESTVLDLSHDGYARQFGFRHGRRLELEAEGARLLGEDRLIAEDGRKASHLPYAIRFHLHPSLRAAPVEEGSAVMLRFGSGERWIFKAGGLPVSVEESIFFASAEGPRRTDQIVIRANTSDVAAVRWSFARQPRD